MTRWLALVAVLATSTYGRAQVPPPTAAPGNERPQTNPGGAGTPPPAVGPTPKVCVLEPRPTTKVVYGSVCKQYCLPSCSLLGLFDRCCGRCSACGCGEVRTRN